MSKSLCLSPHPDDVEYGMGASILQGAFTEEYTVVTLSIGSLGDHKSGEQRRKEVRKFWEGVDWVDVQFADTCYFHEKDYEGWIRFLELCFAGKADYENIFVPPLLDSHQQHRFVSELGRSLIRNSPISLIEYATPSTLPDWTPNLYIESPNLDDKIRRLNCFRSQSHRPYFRLDTCRAFHTAMVPAKKGVPLVERFRAVEVYG